MIFVICTSFFQMHKKRFKLNNNNFLELNDSKLHNRNLANVYRIWYACVKKTESVIELTKQLTISRCIGIKQNDIRRLVSVLRWLRRLRVAATRISFKFEIRNGNFMFFNVCPSVDRYVQFNMSSLHWIWFLKVSS